MALHGGEKGRTVQPRIYTFRKSPVVKCIFFSKAKCVNVATFPHQNIPDKDGR